MPNVHKESRFCQLTVEPLEVTHSWSFSDASTDILPGQLSEIAKIGAFLKEKNVFLGVPSRGEYVSRRFQHDQSTDDQHLDAVNLVGMIVTY